MSMRGSIIASDAERFEGPNGQRLRLYSSDRNHSAPRLEEVRKDSPTTVYSGDWLRERGRLEPSVLREFVPTENRRKCSRSFASQSAKHRPENELAFSSVRT